MVRVTRRQAAAAAQSSDAGDDGTPAPTTTGTAKSTSTRKRTIAASNTAGSNIIDSTDNGQTDKATSSQPKKRKTTKATKVTKAAKATKVTKDTADEDAISQDKVKDDVDKKPAAPDPITAEKEVGKVPMAEGGIANSKDLVIPMDTVAARDGRLTTDFIVYIDPSGMIYDTSLNQTNAANNNNKFYLAQILENKATSKYYCWTRWGRVGETGQSALLGQGTLNDALKNFEKKFKDKSGLRWDDRTAAPKAGKYAYVERSYDPDSDDEDDEKAAKQEAGDAAVEVAAPAECTLVKPVRELVELIFNQNFFNNTMMSFNYDSNKLPLGKLGRTTITRGFQALKDLSAVLNDSGVAARDHNMTPLAAIEHFSNLYYSVIPHSFGRNRPPVINSHDVLKREVDMLESLSDMKAAADILKETDSSGVHRLDQQFRGLNLEEMTHLSPTSKEYKTLTAYLHGSVGSTHGYKYDVIDVFRIARPFEKERFENSPYAKVKSDKRLLWHGSRCTNFGGILSQGLRIAPPEAPSTGYMFGKGIYLADTSSKSAGYTWSHSSDGNALLLLCEAELGDPMQKLVRAQYNAGETAKQGGMISTMGQGDTGPQKWIDASIAHPSLKGIKMPDPKVAPGPTNIQGAGLLYNEYIAYDIAQVQLRYLFRVKM